MAYYHCVKGMKEIKLPSDAPKRPHYLIIYFDSKTIHHEGDERSRSCPGHGYPAYSETMETHKIYYTDDKEIWRGAIEAFYKEDQHRKDILCYEVLNQPSVTMKVVIQ